MHGGLNDIGHDIAGGKNDERASISRSLARHDVDCASGGIERDSVRLEQPRAARKRSPEQAMRQLQGIGISRAGDTIAPARAMPKAVKQRP
jgi:hypothetical protein